MFRGVHCVFFKGRPIVVQVNYNIRVGLMAQGMIISYMKSIFKLYTRGSLVFRSILRKVSISSVLMLKEGFIILSFESVSCASVLTYSTLCFGY